MARRAQGITKYYPSTTKLLRPKRVVPFIYETKRSIPRELILVVVLLGSFLWVQSSKGHSRDIPVPHPHKYGALAERMYECNTKSHRWTEAEIKCAIYLRFAPVGQYENAIRIARCETGDTWNPRIVSHTDDHGIFQINRRWNGEGWRLGADIYDPVWNTRIAYWFWQTRGWSDWVCARLTGVS